MIDRVLQARTVKRIQRFLGIAGIIFMIILLIKVAFMVIIGANILSFLQLDHGYKGVNILVVGTDNVQDSTRSDAIAVVHVNHKKTRVHVVSIPRDTRVMVEGVGVSKMNHAYAHGGIRLLKSTVSQFLNVPVDHYIVLNQSGVSRMIDLIGGVNVVVDQPMKYDDFAGELHINFDAGQHHLDGQSLIQFLRFRHNSKGDIGRISRHQEVGEALFKQFFKFNTLLVSPQLIHAFRQSFKTDFSLLNMTQFIRAFIQNNDQLSIAFDTIPGVVRLIDGVSYWDPSSDRLNDIIAKGFMDELPVPQSIDGGQSMPTYNLSKIDDAQMVSQQLTQNKNDHLALANVTGTTAQGDGVVNDVNVDNKNEIIGDVKLDVAKKVDHLTLTRKPSLFSRLKREAKTPTVVAIDGIIIEVLNGNGRVGEAAQLAKVLVANKASVFKVTNSMQFNYDYSKIVDWKGQSKKSAALADFLNIDPKHIISYDRVNKPIDITLVLGHDWNTEQMDVALNER